MFSTNPLSRLVSVVLYGVPYTWQRKPDSVIDFLSFRRQSTRQFKGPWREPCLLEKPFKGTRLRRGSCWEERKRIVFSRQSTTYLGFLIFDNLRPPWRGSSCCWGEVCSRKEKEMGRRQVRGSLGKPRGKGEESCKKMTRKLNSQ